MRVAVLYNDDRGLGGAGLDRAAVEGVRSAADAAAAALRELGHQVTLLPTGEDPAALIDALGAARPEVAFNLIESIDGRARLESAAAWILEWLGVPFTGSPPEVLSLALDKAISKAVLAQAGIPVPRGVVLEDGSEAFEHLPAPWIVKPLQLDASHGIDGDSAGADPARIRDKARAVIARYGGPVLVEELIEGRELNVSILGAGARAVALPPGEIDFSRLAPGRPRILTYAAKWEQESPDYLGTPVIDARLDAAETDAVERLALGAYRALGVRGYGRVDLRLDPSRGPVVLEVNPNPDLSPGAGLSRAAARRGLDHVRLVAAILESALRP